MPKWWKLFRKKRPSVDSSTKLAKSGNSTQDRSAIDCSQRSLKSKTEKNLLNNEEGIDFEKRLTAVEILLYLGVPVNPKTANQGTPLHLAVRNNCLEVVRLLVEYKANVHEVNRDKRTPLHLCAEFGDLKMAELLLKHCEIRPTTAVGGKYEIAEDVSTQDIQLAKLMLNCSNKQADEIRSQLIAILILTDLVDEHSRREYKEYKRTHYTDDSCSCLLFLERAYNVSIPNSRPFDWEKGWTSYQKAQCKYHRKLAKFTLNKQRHQIDRYICSWMQHTLKQVSEMKMLENNPTPLHLAVGTCCPTVILRDFHQQLADALCLNNIDKTPITCFKDNMLLKCFILSLDHANECKINHLNPFNRNSYDEPNQSKTLKITENVKSYVNRRDNEGYDTLLKAIEFNQTDVVQLLLRSGADTCSITSQGYAALHIAINSNHCVLKTSDPVEMIKCLLTSGEFSVNALSFKAETPLHLATSNCGCRLSEKDSEEFKRRRMIQDSVISLLLENKSNINQQDCEGMTPLMIASERGCSHIVKTLLDWNLVRVDLNARDKYGETALIKAARMHHTEIVELLVTDWARVDIQDYRGFTALHASLHNPDEFTILFKLRENEFQDAGLTSNEANEKVIKRVKDAALLRVKTTLNGERDGKKTLIEVLLRNGHQFETLDFANSTPFDFLVESEIQSCRSRKEAQERLDKMRKENTLFKETPYHLDCNWLYIKRRRESPLYWLAALCIMIAEHKSIQPGEVERIANIQDNKERTVLHYAAILSGFDKLADRSSVFKALLNSGCEIDAQDIYQRTPLHYMDVSNSNLLLGTFEHTEMESSEQQQLIVREILKIKDVDDKTVEQLWTLRIENAERERTRASNYHKAVKAVDLGSIRYDNGTMHIYKRGIYNFETGISWSIWKNGVTDYAHRNTVTSCLTEEIHHFIERLVNAIERREPCFKCQPMLVGSAFEGTKIGSQDEFDFDLILTKFSNLVEVIPSPVAPDGFVHLRRKSNVSLKENDERFFDDEGMLKTYEINCRFQIILNKVFQDPSFWENEHLFELTDAEETTKKIVRWYGRHKSGRDLNDLTDQRINSSICTTIRLKQTRALEGEYLPTDISLDLVPCVHVDGWWPDKARSDISDTLKADGCNLVFDQPQRKFPWIPFRENYARISFAPSESRIIRDSSSTAKAAYMVCKHLIKDKPQMTYVLKTCLLYCIEALDRENERSIDEESIYSSVTAEKLSLWVEKLMRCYLMFFLLDFCPCYPMPCFCLPIGDFLKSNHMLLHVTGENDYEFLKEENQSYRCSVREVYIANFDLLRRVCTSETDIPLPKPQPLCERFSCDEFISQLRVCSVDDQN